MIDPTKHRQLEELDTVNLCTQIFTNARNELYLNMHYFTDMARLGAQVVAGIGFIGAGTIIVTKRQRVKGLTTAAGLWAAAIIGLVCGAGYAECAIFATAVVLLVMVIGINALSGAAAKRIARRTQ